jgi:hypothetical protein
MAARWRWFGWTLVTGLSLTACGGRTTTATPALDGAASGAADSASTEATAGEGTDSTSPVPSVVQLVTGDGGAPTAARATPECIPGFQGFQATVDDQSIDFKAFVAQPGDYTGDSLHILWLDVKTATGQNYRAAVVPSGSTGRISVHVVAAEPRFVGSLEAVATDLDDANAPPLVLALTFDIAVRDGCR